MPLKKGRSKKVVRENIDEMVNHPGPHFTKIIAKYGKAKAYKIAAAAAHRQAGSSRKSKKRGKK